MLYPVSKYAAFLLSLQDHPQQPSSQAALLNRVQTWVQDCQRS